MMTTTFSNILRDERKAEGDTGRHGRALALPCSFIVGEGRLASLLCEGEGNDG